MPSNCTVYVGNISSRVREKDMKRKFEKYGKIRRFELLRDFAFVDYEDPDDARDAIENLDGYDMEGRALQVALARSQNGGGYRGRSPDSRSSGGSSRPRMGHEVGSGIRGGAVRGRRDNCILVKNLSSKIGWQDLKDWARQCGAVEYADIWSDRGKKYGVIKFDNKKDVSYAIEKLDDQYLDGRRVHVIEDNGQWQASVSRSPSSGSRSRSRSKSKKSKKSSKEKESKENKERSRSRSDSPDKSSKRKKRGDDSDDEGRKKKDKKKKKDRSNSPEGTGSSSSFVTDESNR